MGRTDDSVRQKKKYLNIRKPNDKPRNRNIAVLLSDDEFARLMALADGKNMTISDVVRSLIPKPEKPDVQPAPAHPQVP